MTIDAIGVVRRTLVGGGAGAPTFTGSQFASLTIAASATVLDAAE